jgi:hypothetical protein
LANPGPTGFTGQWFADASGGTALAPTTALSNQYLSSRTKQSSIATLGSGFGVQQGFAIQADGKILVADFQNNLVKDRCRWNWNRNARIFFSTISVTVEAGTILIEFNSRNVIKE